MATLSHKTFGNESLEKWELVGHGGFGYVYKARHKGWGFDVAVKILHESVCPFKALCEEANCMDMASCEFVLRRYGTYQGCLPDGGTSIQQGIMMEFMERGSVQSLQKKLSGPPPWPLVFRLAHQVALGMNFLHSQNLMHQDLKPSNVLLNSDLNAKLADFGLARVSTSALNSNTETTGEIGGSYKYMPPEAFEPSYEPVRAFDVYSYGILLWSIAAGTEPYPMADYARVELRIPLGDRPLSKVFDQVKADGLEELIDLMTRCWDHSPLERPTFKKCVEVTENLLPKQPQEIHDAVGQVLKRLVSPTSNRSNTSGAFNAPLQTPEQPTNDSVDFGRFQKIETSSTQDSACYSTKRMNNKDKAKFVDDNRAMLIQNVSEVMAIIEELGDMVHGETYSLIDAKATSREKMRALYDRTLRSGGEQVKAAFYDALKSHHPRLV
ncbi:receptor-interacting serine/threonine-protein kinase 3-like isoform X2 [Cottoperca gobio]|uniref:Receptor-interacting serine/threonine-protein kinase 3-like isoform X2 n=1 Tax=Cottoperca gobio TaxID=56716 RepID=A0A6J2PXS0_COTGO|nr:receptor-interacting serine/threonine-protein kinase 3-like isoform X2 [Cottoperca gobio]